MPREIELAARECHEGQNVTVWHVSKKSGRRDWGQGGSIIAVDHEHITIRTPIGVVEQYHMDDHMVVAEVPWDLDECVEFEVGVCRGTVDHYSPSGFGGPLRCEVHRNARYERYRNSMERYAESGCEPDWFDAADIGEVWACND